MGKLERVEPYGLEFIHIGGENQESKYSGQDVRPGDPKGWATKAPRKPNL
ncbi:MAG: hypothetical protein N3D72_01230 [Candidatus Methanomethyliaceae archaeon]|nr:hypothetical protein [Candidatus Methanomethyliaceae archaeon]